MQTLKWIEGDGQTQTKQFIFLLKEDLSVRYNFTKRDLMKIKLKTTNMRYLSST